MTVPPTTVSDPSQSMAFNPAMMGVVGVLMSRKRNKMMKAIPSTGTRIVQLTSTKCILSSERGHTIDVEAPTPRDKLSKDSAKNWPESACNGPNHTNHSKVNASTPDFGSAAIFSMATEFVFCEDIPHAKKITDANVHQNNQSTASNSLKHSPAQEHLDINAQSTNQRPDEEYHICNQDDRLSSENITYFAPCRGRSYSTKLEKGNKVEKI